MTNPEIHQIPITSINIPRESRQRKELAGIEALANSISRVGLINPITIDQDNNLIAGERRLTACISLGWTEIPATLYSELSQSQLQLIELEENIARADLVWQDHVSAICKIYKLYKSEGLEPEKIYEALNLTRQQVQSIIAVQHEITKPNSPVAANSTLSSAIAHTRRIQERIKDNEKNTLLEALSSPPPSDDSRPIQEIPEGTEYASPEPKITQAPISPFAFSNLDFRTFAQSYSGERFNFIHCDFPYGIDHHNSDQGGTATGRHLAYDDSEATYWSLCQALCDNLQTLLMPSSHILFWFSMKHYSATMRFFEFHAPELEIYYLPYIWHKSDNKGILPDPSRYPRNITEFALIMRYGDRRQLKAISNHYSCPTGKSKSLHVSEKPEPMLRYFLSAYIDSHSRILDPTCGSGSSLRAARSLGAYSGLGLDIEQEHITNAEKEFRVAENLSNLSTQLGV